MPETTNSNNTTVAKTSHGKGFAITSMVCGIVSIVCCCATGLAVILAILALVFGIIAIVKKYPAKGMAIAGVVTGAVGVLAAIIVYISVISVANSILDSINKLRLGQHRLERNRLGRIILPSIDN